MNIKLPFETSTRFHVLNTLKRLVIEGGQCCTSTGLFWYNDTWHTMWWINTTFMPPAVTAVSVSSRVSIAVYSPSIAPMFLTTQTHLKAPDYIIILQQSWRGVNHSTSDASAFPISSEVPISGWLSCAVMHGSAAKLVTSSTVARR